MPAKKTAKKPTKSKSSAKSIAAQKKTVKKQTPSKAKGSAKKTSAKKSTTKKSTVKKSVKKSTPKKSTAKKSSTAKKTTAKKSVAKSASKKTSAKSAKAKKSTPKAIAKKSTPKKTSAKKIVAKKSAQKKASSSTKATSVKKKAAAKKSIPKKSVTKKSPPKKPISKTTLAPKRSKGSKVVPTAPRVKVQEFPTTNWGPNLVIHFEIAEQLPPAHLTSIAGGLVFHDNKALLANVPGRGWEIIGGRIDLNEDPEITFRREVELQLGVTLSHVKLLGLLRIEHVGPMPPNCPYPYPVAYGIQFLAIMDEMLPFKGSVDSLGRSLITMDGLPEHYYGWNDHHEAVFKYALEEYQKWCKKLKIKP